MDVKKSGQIFTPHHIVESMIHIVDLKNIDLMNVKIMEPSFGTGNFLIPIIEEMITYAHINRIDDDQLISAIEYNVCGFEKDPELFEIAQKRVLNLLQKEGIKTFPKNLICGDALLKYSAYINKIDVCIGNPPYIRIHHMDSDTKKNLSRLRFTKGNTDLYIQFYDIGLQMLKPNGVLSYISPNSFMYNSSQKDFRCYLVEKRLIHSIYDFGDKEVFRDASTHSCICTCAKTVKNAMLYGRCNPTDLCLQHLIRFDTMEKFHGDKWFFDREDRMINQLSKNGRKLSDVCVAKYGLATGADNIYTGCAFIDKEEKIPYDPTIHKLDSVYFHKSMIESAVLKKCVKASRLNQNSVMKYIIYPYYNTKDGIMPISENDMITKYPLAYQYLKNHKEKLLQRDMRGDAPWYAYSRTQGLAYMNQPKLALKHIFSIQGDSVEVFDVDCETFVYSGLFLAVKETMDISIIKSALESREFKKYCVMVGKPMHNGYVMINGKQLLNYIYM